MHNKTITSLAILKSNWDSNKKDYIDTFVPLFVHLLKKNKYEAVDAEKIRKDFFEEFQFEIPIYPILAILTRLKKYGFTYKKDHEYLAVQEKLKEIKFDDRIQEEGRKLSSLIESFRDFVKTEHNIEVSAKESEETILSFFRDTDTSLLFGSDSISSLPEAKIRASKSKKYLFAVFTDEARRANPTIFNFLVDISIGHALASALLYNEKLNNYTSKFNGLSFYLDATIVFDLLGVNGEIRQFAQTELLKDIKIFGGKLLLFEHTLDEVDHVLRNAAQWVDSPSLDYTKASKTLRYFLGQGNVSSSDIELFLSRVPRKLQDLNIQTVAKPDYLDEKFQIDEKEAQEVLVAAYKKRDPYFDEIAREITIRKDIDSIAAIYRLRKGVSPKNLKDARFVFLTSNSSLAQVSSEIDRIGGIVSIPVCLTNIFVGTLIWLQSPARIRIINEGRLSTQVYGILQPDRKLISKYVDEINKLKEAGDITEDDYYLLRGNRLVYELLPDKSLGDADLLNTETVIELLDEVKNRVVAPTAKLYESEREAHATTKLRLEIQESQSLILEKKYNKLIENITKGCSAVFAGILIGIYFFGTFGNAFHLSTLFQILLGILIVVCSVFGFDFFKLRSWVSVKISNFLTRV